MGKRKESFLEAGKGEVVEAVRPIEFSDPMSEESGKVGEQPEMKGSSIFGISGRDQQGKTP